MDVTFSLNGSDWSAKLSTYEVKQEITYRKVITTLDDVEHAYPGAIRTILAVSFWPLSDEQTSELFSDLESLILSVTYTNPHKNMDETKQMRLVSSLNSVFGLRSVDGNRYYKGGTVELRQV